MNPAKAKILIIDDKKENLLALSALLEEFSVEVHEAQSGNDALAMVLENHYALILLDVQMPEMNGFEVAEVIRSREKTKYVPIIFVTAINKEQKYIFQGYEAGAVDYLFKPIDPIILKSKVKVFLELYRQKTTIENDLKEKTILLKEIHHRVSNNLNLILGFIELQRVRTSEVETDLFLSELSNKILSVALIHKKLYGSKNLSHINLKEYISDLAFSILDSFNSNPNISVKIDMEDDELPVNETLSLGILVSELIINSLKYAFNESGGKIQVSYHTVPEKKLIVQDNGKGLKAGFDTKKSPSLGFKIIYSIVEKLNARLNIDESHGLKFEIVFSPNT